MHMCYFLVVEILRKANPNSFSFYDQNKFSKNPKQTHKNEKSDFFKGKNLKQTGPLYFQGSYLHS